MAAQERVEFIRNFETETVFQEYSVGFTNFGERGRTTVLPQTAGGSNWVPLSGSRYLVGISWSYSTGFALVAVDRRTRSIVATLPTTDRVAILIADPVRPRVFYSDGHKVLGFDASNLSSWIISPDTAFSMVYAPTVDRLYLLTGPNPFIDPHTPRQVTVVNATSGLVLNQFPTTGLSGMVVDSGGRRLYMPVQGQTSFFTEIAAYDPETGLEVARTAHPGELVLDEPRGLLFGTVSGAVTILDAGTLATIQQVSIPRLSGPGNPRLSVRPGRLMSAVHVVQGTVTSGHCWRQAITTFNIDGRSRGTLDLSDPASPPSRAFPCGEIVLLEAPPSPSTPAASVVGSNVHLTWENAGNVSEFELQVGFAPGAPVLFHRVGLDTSIDVTNVPPGVYYLRVRAINEIGTSPPSPEIRLVVN